MSVRHEVGLLVDGFRLEEPIHRGNMSELWVVTREDIDFPIVMKLPLMGRGDDAAAIVAFEAEQMILPTLSTPHAPRFVTAGDFSGEPHIVMERIPGVSLRPRFYEAPLGIEEIVRTGACVADALHAVHGQHVIHLDVKPSNIMFREGDKAVLLDYGLARHDHLPDLLAEEFHRPIGTAPYISPEQVLHIRNDLRSDIFALGVILYYLVTGTRPYGNPSSVHGLRRRLYRDPPPPRALRADCPRWLQEIVLRCLEVDARERYDTAAQLAFALRHPDQVELTVRAERTSSDSRIKVARRWLRALGMHPDPQHSARIGVLAAPILVVAVDLARGAERLAETLREAAYKLLASQPRSRLACVTVLKTARIAIEADGGEGGTSAHVQRLVELRHWAAPLELPQNRITFHVLQAPDPAAAIVQFACANHADHILIGARGSSAFRRYLGSVSSQVVAEAPCSVTVVRAEYGGEAQQPGSASDVTVAALREPKRVSEM
jgi:nucleotide-binding universal stress UspA family protein